MGRFVPGTKEWLDHKTDHARRYPEMLEYIKRFAPELLDPNWNTQLGLVVDLGCGPGEFLEIARENGHPVLGVDGETGTNGMGDEYLNRSRKLTSGASLPVEYVGFLKWLPTPHKDPASLIGTVSFINSRGSIEQMLSCCMGGEPHHLHHDCRKLYWQMPALFILQWSIWHLCNLLRDGGYLLIHANGSRNDELYSKSVREAAACGGCELVFSQEPVIHKWVKVRDAKLLPDAPAVDMIEPQFRTAASHVATGKASANEGRDFI